MFAATHPSMKILRSQWEGQPELGPHTGGVDIISPDWLR